MDAFTTTDWSPAIEAAAKAIYDRLRLNTDKSKWPKVGDGVRDHYCIAARNAVVAFHATAAKSVEVEVLGEGL